MNMGINIDRAHLRQWIGRTDQQEDLVTPRLVAAYRATLSTHLASVAHPQAPLGLQWCLAQPAVDMQGLGPDGHPDRTNDPDSFLPPVPLPRRMWAGGRIETLEPLRMGDRVTRHSIINDITIKEGRAGTLCFVTVGHTYSTERGNAIIERQDIVYRAAPAAPATAQTQAATQAPADHAAHTDMTQTDVIWAIQTSPTLLFRYSALTFNGHRIHYDFPYATEVEGYAGLVVHGPLQASLLFNLAANVGGGVPRSFEYRGLAPLISGATMQVCGKQLEGDQDGAVRCWTQTPDGAKRMEATATW